VASNDITLLIFQFCLGRFEGPSEFAVFAGLAGIDCDPEACAAKTASSPGPPELHPELWVEVSSAHWPPEADASSQDDEAHEQRPGSCKCMHRVIVAGQEKRSTISASCDCVVPLRSALLYNLPE